MVEKDERAEESVATLDANEKEMGLCSTCEDVEDCTFPMARKGVQYCEEYK
jgi:hypothetical protein